ncbi:MAG: N-acetyl-alpha-D-glucosaminyl L-malate synthase BshA [Clostridia bacterium]|nr:N-acetyl-alpha-D-glucosaminyl L-malate synthase BshA [Clostridia bacterium]
MTGAGPKRRLRVGLVGYPTPGGSGVVATELAHELARSGHEVHLFSHDVPFRLNRQPGLVYHAVEPPEHPVLLAAPYEMALAGEIAKVHERTPLDVIHAHFAVPHATAALVAARMARPPRPAVVVTLHGSDVTVLADDPALRRTLAYALAEADAVTAVSAWLAGLAASKFALARPVAVIPNFVNLDVYRPQPDPRLRARYAGPDETVVLHASNFRPVKRVVDVVRAFARLSRRVPARLLFVGEGPDCPAAYREAVAEGVAERVTFLGVQPQIVPWLGIADVFLLPSAEEGFGLSALEAMACGVPVVATDVGGLPEVVEHGVSGFLLRPGDVAAMAEAALRLSLDRSLAARVREAALARVRERFDARLVVPRYVETYLAARRALHG